MNAAEHIVEGYYRHCKKNFTITDVKVIRGVNRQFDLLAIDLKSGEQFHIESSVTHSFTISADDLCAELERKFLGVPPKREGANTDHSRGKRYLNEINETYRSVGFEPEKIQRVFVTWQVKGIGRLRECLEAFARKSFPVSVISFRDTILPELQKVIGTSNYDDEALRTLSLIRQMEIQTRIKKPLE
jgi:hypothetical protein